MLPAVNGSLKNINTTPGIQRGLRTLYRTDRQLIFIIKNWSLGPNKHPLARRMLSYLGNNGNQIYDHIITTYIHLHEFTSQTYYDNPKINAIVVFKGTENGRLDLIICHHGPVPSISISSSLFDSACI